MFSDEFLDSLPSDPLKAAHVLCSEFLKVDERFRHTGRISENYDEYVEAFAGLGTLIEVVRLSFSVPPLGPDRTGNIAKIREYFLQIFPKLEEKVLESKLSSARDRFKVRFGTIFLYEFSDGDLKRIQELINELRDLITDSELWDANHKERILKKLEALQGELHKRMSSVDKLWGLIGEGGVALGKFGKDAKPFVDRIREIAQIVWRTQARAEELPSGTPLTLLTRGRTENDQGEPNN